MKNVGIIVIGDEILNGNVVDSNSNFLCVRFHALGLKVRKISFIPDELEIISQEVATFSKLYDIVITTGGVGPTHDDITYESVARAFNSDLLLNKGMEKFFHSYLKYGDGNDLRLVTIPSCSEVLYVELEKPLFEYKTFPIVKTFNVYNFPGIPSYVQRIFDGLQEHFESSEQFITRNIYLIVPEMCIVKVLNFVAEKFKNSVTFGSYPCVNDANMFKTKVTIESVSYEKCLTAENELLSRISPSWVVYRNSGLPDFEFIHRLSSGGGDLSEKIQKSFKIFENCFSKYSFADTFISFNGGKDCTVLFNLLYCYCWKNKINQPLNLVYFNDENSFPELDSFIEFIKNCYNVELRILPTPMKDSLQLYLQTKPKKRACFLGLRRNDPNGENLKPMQETDEGWPKMMRVFPILHWSYMDIWNFLRSANIPYCSLYNRGYTSLGNTGNTSPNPALKYVEDDGVVCYKPAFLLSEEQSERHGR